MGFSLALFILNTNQAEIFRIFNFNTFLNPFKSKKEQYVPFFLKIKSKPLYVKF